MADLSYIYAHYYGVEPFDPSTVGALNTGHNLVVTLWTVADKVDFIPVPGVLVQPATQNDNLLAARRVASVQAMSSRCSAQVFLFQAEVGATLTDPLLFVLNPPPELRQQMSQVVTFNGGDPTDPANYTVARSLMGGYTWRVELEESIESQDFISPTISLAYSWGTLTDLGNYNGSTGQSIPLLKTNGADGVAPEFFDRTTAQGVAEMLAAVNAGDFFVPLIVFADVTDPTRLTITYPHSVARG